MCTFIGRYRLFVYPPRGSFESVPSIFPRLVLYLLLNTQHTHQYIVGTTSICELKPLDSSTSSPHPGAWGPAGTHYIVMRGLYIYIFWAAVKKRHSQYGPVNEKPPLLAVWYCTTLLSYHPSATLSLGVIFWRFGCRSCTWAQAIDCCSGRAWLQM